MEVIATSGDAHLGGDDFNAIIVNWIFEQLTAEHGLDRSNSLRGNVFAYSRISQAAEEAKIVLSSKAQVEIRLPYVMDGISIAYNLTRPKFESMSKGLLRRLLRPVREVAVMAGINLPGESGLMGVVDDEGDLYSSSEEEGIDAMFESENTTDVGGSSDKNSDLSAKDMHRLQTMGQRNARERNRLKGDTMKQVRALQRSTGDSSLGSFPGGQPLNEVLLVGGASRMPSVQRLVRVVTGVEPHKSVNPDEAVSLGAAVMAGILDGHISGMDVVSAWQAAVYRTLFEERNRLEEGDWRKDEVIKSSKGVVSVTTNVVSEKVVQTVKRKENLDPNTVRKSVPNLRRLSTVRRKKLNESK